MKKVKWSRYRPGVAQRVGRGIALLLHDSGTRRVWVVSSTLRPHFTPEKDPVHIFTEARWAPGPVWTGGKSRLHRDSIPDSPACSSVVIPTELTGSLVEVLEVWIHQFLTSKLDGGYCWTWVPLAFPPSWHLVSTGWKIAWNSEAVRKLLGKRKIFFTVPGTSLGLFKSRS